MFPGYGEISMHVHTSVGLNNVPVDSVIVPQSIFTTEIIQDSRVKTHSFLMSLLVDDGCSSGAHNEVRVEGKGRSLQQPHKKLKCENFPMEVLLLLYGL